MLNCQYIGESILTVGARRRHLIFWNRSYRWLWASTWGWELSRGLLQEQTLLLTTELSLQPVRSPFDESHFHCTRQQLL